MVVVEVGAAWQDMGCGRGGFCVNFDLICFLWVIFWIWNLLLV